MKKFLKAIRPNKKTSMSNNTARLAESLAYGTQHVPPLSALLLADMGPFSAGPGN